MKYLKSINLKIMNLLLNYNGKYLKIKTIENKS